MESKEMFLIFYFKVRLLSMDVIENGVQTKILDCLLKSMAIVYGFYRNWSPKKSS